MTTQDPTPEPVATGDRRDEVRMESDPGQLVRMRATFKPDAPPPEQVANCHDPHAEPAVTDVAVAPETPSVWDARPADEDR